MAFLKRLNLLTGRAMARATWISHVSLFAACVATLLEFQGKAEHCTTPDKRCFASNMHAENKDTGDIS